MSMPAATTTTADITPPTLTLKLAALLAVVEAEAALDEDDAEAAALPASFAALVSALVDAIALHALQNVNY
jgi:hypothetical protein